MFKDEYNSPLRIDIKNYNTNYNANLTEYPFSNSKISQVYEHDEDPHWAQYDSRNS